MQWFKQLQVGTFDSPRNTNARKPIIHRPEGGGLAVFDPPRIRPAGAAGRGLRHYHKTNELGMERYHKGF